MHRMCQFRTDSRDIAYRDGDSWGARNALWSDVGSSCMGKVVTLDWLNLAGFVVMDPEPTRSLADAGGCFK